MAQLSPGIALLRRRGFATFTALVLVTLVGACLAALAVAFAGDVKRSVRQTDDAQLRQLLLAGEVAVRDALAKGDIVQTAVSLPGDLSAAGASVTFEKIDASSPAETRIRLTATLGDRRTQSETLTYARGDETWSLRSVED